MQVWIGVVPFGPNGVALNSSYQSRESPQYMSDLGNAVANFARLVPDGLLVFFPSYHVLDKCTSHWKSDVSNGADAALCAACLVEGAVKVQACLQESHVRDHARVAGQTRAAARMTFCCCLSVALQRHAHTSMLCLDCSIRLRTALVVGCHAFISSGVYHAHHAPRMPGLMLAAGFVGQSIWDRIARKKQPVMEPRDSNTFPAAADDFRAKLADPSTSGAVFFAVCK